MAASQLHTGAAERAAGRISRHDHRKDGWSSGKGHCIVQTLPGQNGSPGTGRHRLMTPETCIRSIQYRLDLEHSDTPTKR